MPKLGKANVMFYINLFIWPYQLNTKSENNINEHVGRLITMPWQPTYTWKLSEVSIGEGTCNQNLTLHKEPNFTTWAAMAAATLCENSGVIASVDARF